MDPPTAPAWVESMVVTPQGLAALRELERMRAELVGILSLREERTVTRDNCVSNRAGRSSCR